MVMSVSLGRMSTTRFNVLLVGEAALGKKTFIGSLFKDFVGKLLFNEEVRVPGQVSVQEITQFTLPSDVCDCDVHVSNACGFFEETHPRDAVDMIHSHVLKCWDDWSTLNTHIMTEQVQQ